VDIASLPKPLVVTPVKPAAGAATTVAGEVKNLGAKAVTVHWTVSDESKVALGGGDAAIDPNGSKTVTTSAFKPAAGDHTYTLTITVPGESGAGLLNNTKSIAVTVE
jgi:hypothetical protein